MANHRTFIRKTEDGIVKSEKNKIPTVPDSVRLEREGTESLLISQSIRLRCDATLEQRTI